MFFMSNALHTKRPLKLDTCPDCNGAGGGYWDSYDMRGEHRTEDGCCRTCDGTGEVEVYDESDDEAEAA